jgi:hypothetical protein
MKRAGLRWKELLCHWNLPDMFFRGDCWVDLWCVLDACANPLDCGGRPGAGGTRNTRRGQSHSPEGFGYIT